jgi:hypothetical protein
MLTKTDSSTPPLPLPSALGKGGATLLKSEKCDYSAKVVRKNDGDSTKSRWKKCEGCKGVERDKEGAAVWIL